MTTSRRRKSTRQRGCKTHGYGSKKKHRGAGNRGGRGMAGSGKRADHKKQLIIKKYGTEYFGKHGFTSRRKKLKPINISSLENIPLSKEEEGKFTLDLNKIGYNKLLSAGKPTKKYKILVKYFSKKAKEKIEKAGGEIVS